MGTLDPDFPFNARNIMYGNNDVRGGCTKENLGFFPGFIEFFFILLCFELGAVRNRRILVNIANHLLATLERFLIILGCNY